MKPLAETRAVGFSLLPDREVVGGIGRAPLSIFYAQLSGAIDDVQSRQHSQRDALLPVAEPGLHQALRSMAVPHNALAPVRQPRALHLGQERLGFRLHRLRQQPAGAAPPAVSGSSIVSGWGLPRDWGCESERVSSSPFSW